MARSLTTQRTLREASRLPFCYLCGQAFGTYTDTNRDHVPPSGLFAQGDRTPPLILRTHRACNAHRSSEDQAIGQLVGVLHGRKVNPRHNKIRLTLGRSADGTSTIAATQIDVKAAIRRWIRGFHAALYHEYLPEDSVFATYPPMPEGRRRGHRVIYNSVPVVVPNFVERREKGSGVFSDSP